MKLKHTQVSDVRGKIVKVQGGVCPLCTAKLGVRGKTPALDHDHRTGHVRGALCINCNGLEGKVFNRATRAKGKLTELQWLENLVTYLKHHSTPKWGGLIHPTHKTEAEKRLARNKKARLKRAAAKAK